jgi:hypothetical protein
MSVFTRMLIRRAIAAKCYATCLAGPQVNPVRTNFHTLRAFANLRLFDRLDRFQMRAAFRHVV